MKLRQSQLKDILSKLPDFNSYPKYCYTIVILDEPDFTRSIVPEGCVKTSTLRFVKNERLQEWEVDI